jgi:dihydrofolate reductase
MTAIYGMIAIEKRGGIGVNGKLPWHRLDKDMERFHCLINNAVVVMGRKTFEALPNSVKPFPKCVNIVMSRKKNVDDQLPGVIFMNELQVRQYIAALKNQPILRRIVIIGGAQILNTFMRDIDILYLTQIDIPIKNKNMDAYLDISALKRKFANVVWSSPIYNTEVRGYNIPYHFETRVRALGPLGLL